MNSTVLTTLLARDRKFYIIKFKGYYCAVEDKYLDETMHLTQTLNGLQMHAMKELPDCIQSVREAVEVDYLVSEGYTIDDALREVFIKK